MNFGFNDEQELLRSTARKFFENECPSEVVRTLMDTPEGITPALWVKLAEQGWTGLTYPEAYDGMGLGLVDLVVLMEEMGRAVVPGPYFSTVLLGGLAILEGGSEAQKKEWLPKVASGQKRVTLAWLEPSATLGAEGVTLPAAEKGGTFALSGTKLFVPDAHTADAIVVAARTKMGEAEDGVSLFLVPNGTRGLDVKLLPTMDETRKLCEVTLKDVVVGTDGLLGAAGAGWKPLGRAIGSYQGVKHKAADMLVDVENSKSITYYAAWALDEGVAEGPLAASMAKAYVSDAYRRVSAAGIQLHGGIGFTWEHDLHLYFKRAKGSEFTFGDATYHRERVAQLVNL